ncbi:lipopolysaccharide biosynthesis protein [Salinimicrobium sp. CAU 1759]
MKFSLNVKFDSVFQSSIVFTILTFLKPAINIFLLPIYLRLLSPEEYGIYTIVITITTLVAAVGGLKISSAIVPFYYDCKTDEEKNKLLDNIISFIIIFNAFFFIILQLTGPYLFSLVFSSDKIMFFPYISLAIATGMFLPIIEAYSAFVKNEKKIIKYASVQLLFIVSGVLLQIILILNFSLLGVLWAKLLANILTAVLVLFYLKKVIRFRLDKEILKKCLDFSLALIPFFFVFWLGRYADRYVLERYISLSDIGIFGLLMTFAGLVAMASEALANSIQPYLFEAYSDLNDSTKKINQLYLFYGLGLIIFSSFLIAAVSNIHLIKPNEQYLKIIPYFYFAIIPTLLNAIQYLFFNIFTYSKKSKRLAFISVVTVGTQLLVLLLLVQNHKIYAAIFAAFIGNFLSLIWYSLESRSYMKIPYQLKYILPAPIVFFFCLFISIYLGGSGIYEYRHIGLIFPIPVVVILGLIYRKELSFQIFKKKYAK